jgi:chemotaxis protein MotB
MDQTSDTVPASPESPPKQTEAPASRPRRPADELERALNESPVVPEMHWSVPWADLMMTMFVFFAVLFIYASARRDVTESFRGHKAHETVQRDYQALGGRLGAMPVHDRPSAGMLPALGTQQLLETMNAAVRDQGLKDVAVSAEGGAVRIAMHGPLLFDPFSAEVKPEGQRFLHTVARILAMACNPVEVHGHTDNAPVHTPLYPTSWELSTARAVNVARFLMESENLDPARFAVMGHAMYVPAVPNLNTEANKRNARVELVVRRPESETGD